MPDQKLPTRAEDFSEWYNQIVLRAELKKNSHTLRDSRPSWPWSLLVAAKSWKNRW
jgi:hypothetical protein